MENNKLKKLVAIATKSIVQITDPSHPLYDPRVNRERNDYTRADYRENGQRTPIEVMTKENAERIGASFEGGDYTAVAGRGRRGYCEDVEIDFMMAIVVEVRDLAHFRTLALRENSQRDEETFDQQVEKAKLIAEAAKASGQSEEEIVKSVSVSIKRPDSTVRDYLKFTDPTKTSEALTELRKSGEIDYGSMRQLIDLPIEKQPEAVGELSQVQSDALAAAAMNGKLEEAAKNPGKGVRVKTENGDTATITVKEDGTPVVKPSQDTAQKVKSKVQNKKAPESVKTEAERKSAVGLDVALIKTHGGRVAMLRRVPGHDFSELIAGAAMLEALLTGTPYTLADDASETVKAAHARLFPVAKAE